MHPMRFRPAPAAGRRHRRPGLAAAAFLLAASAARGESPWSLLEEVRQDLQAAGPQAAEFVQTYIPAGFTSGDQESGHLSIWLPDCLRWSYVEPEAKNFLVCQGQVYFWHPDEPGGRHYRVDAEREPGLDLLLVDIETLRERYVAESRELPDGTFDVALAPPPGAASGFRAHIRIDPGEKRVLGLELTDEEGNLTRFALSGYQRLAHTALFQPPSDIEWTEE